MVIKNIFSLLYGELLIYLTTKKTHLHEKQIDAQALPDDDSFAISPILSTGYFARAGNLPQHERISAHLQKNFS